MDWALLLARQQLVDSKCNTSRVDQAPDGERVASAGVTGLVLASEIAPVLEAGPSAHMVSGPATVRATAVTATRMVRTRSLVLAMAHLPVGIASGLDAVKMRWKFATAGQLATSAAVRATSGGRLSPRAPPMLLPPSPPNPSRSAMKSTILQNHEHADVDHQRSSDRFVAAHPRDHADDHAAPGETGCRSRHRKPTPALLGHKEGRRLLHARWDARSDRLPDKDDDVDRRGQQGESTRRLSRDRLRAGSLEAGKGDIVASQDLLNLLRDLLDRTAVRHSSVKVGEESAHGSGQAYCQVLHRRAEHRFGVQAPGGMVITEPGPRSKASSSTRTIIRPLRT